MADIAGLDFSEGPPWMPLYQLQATHMRFATEADARAARVLGWGDLQEVLGRTCKSPPVWGGTDCGAHRGCTSCKLLADDTVTNPLRSRPEVLRAFPSALRLFDRLCAEHDLLRDNLLESAEAVLAAPGVLGPHRAGLELVKEWPYVTLIAREALELLFVYHIPIEDIIFRTVMVNIDRRDALRFQILYEPGSMRLRYIPRSPCAIGCLVSCTTPSKALPITEWIELLLGAHTLCYYYPGTLPFVQTFLINLSKDIASTIMSSIRMQPTAPYIPWSPLPMERGEAGLVYSPRIGPLLSGPYAPQGPGTSSPPRLVTTDSDVSMPPAEDAPAPPRQSDASTGRPS